MKINATAGSGGDDLVQKEVNAPEVLTGSGRTVA